MRWGLILGCLLACAISSPSLAQTDPGGIAVDVFETQAVSSGQNAGEIGQFQGMVFHHWLNHPNLGNTGVVITQQRIKDAEGVLLNDERRSPNYVSGVFPTVHKDGPPNGTGCGDHTWKGWWFGGNGAGVFDWETSLSARGAEPGYYKIWFEWHGIVKTYERGYLVQRMQPYILKFKDQYGNAFGGLSVNQLEPYAATIGTSDANSGWISTQFAPGPYQLQISGPQTEGRYYEFYVQPVDDTPELLELNITVERMAGQPSTTKGQFTVNVVGKDTGQPVQANIVFSAGQFQTSAGGQYTSAMIEAGTYGLQVTASGYHPGTVEVKVVAGITRTYNVKLIPATDPVGPPEVEEPTEGINTGWLESLLYPKKETLQDWQELIDEMKAWGPFGAVNSFWTAWNGAARTGESALVWSLALEPFGAGVGSFNVVIDLRPTLPNAGAYPDGGKGSVPGNFIRHGRVLSGWGVWVVFFIAVFRWVRPRFSM